MSATPSRRRRCWARAGALGGTGTAAARSRAPLRVVLAPFLSPAALLTAYRPLREHLERSCSARWRW